MREKTILLLGFPGRVACCMILLLFFSAFVQDAFAQGGQKVSGKVTDENGEPLPGVNVVIKESSTGTITDLDGNFAVNAPSGAILSFSFIGYEPQEVTVSSRSTIDVGMKLDIESLDEVVVVGFAEQKKESVVGSIVTTTGEDVVKSGGVTTVSEALAGLMPGVTTQQNAGIPGASQAEILIRGKSSWNNNSPLVLVDGVERDMNNIDPNEIASITVLKDASATAVFGARAGNGAIIVTTKTGTSGKVNVNFSANFGMKQPTIDTDFMADMPTNLRHLNIAAMNDRQYSSLIPEETIAAWEDPNRNPDLYSYTDWVSELLQTGYNQSYNLNISGGNEFVKYFTSFGHNNDGDIFDLEKQSDYDPRTWQKRYNYRANVDINLTKSTTVKMKLAGEITNWNGNFVTAAGGGTGFSQGSGSGRNLYLQQFYNWPMVSAPPVFSTGEFGIEQGVAENPNYLVRMQHNGSVQRKSNKLWTDFGLEQDLSSLVEGLKLRGKVAYNSYFQYRQETKHEIIQYYAEEVPVQGSDQTEIELIQYGSNTQNVQKPPVLGDETLDSYNRSLYYEGGIDYANTFGAHSVSALGLFYRQESQNKVEFKSVLESWIGRVTYNYDERYFFEMNGAYNGSEKFAPGNRFGFFPSGAIGWMVSNESFMRGAKRWLDHLKIRYSYGVVGSEKSAARFAYVSTYSINNTADQVPYFGQNKESIATYKEGKVANPGATWEESTKQNLGFEFGFLDSRLTLDVELYDEKRENIFLNRKSVSVFTGFPGAVQANIGSTESHGIEFDLQWKEAVSADFSYFVKANLSLAENRVIFKDDQRFAPEYQKEAGKPIGSWRGLMVDSYLDSWDEVYNTTESSWGTESLIPGDFQYVDYNADGIINVLDQVVIKQPSYAANAYAFSGGVSYKGLSLMARFTGVFNMAKYMSPSYLWEYETRSILGFQLNNNEQRDYWTEDNLDASHPALHLSSTHNRQTSTHTIRKADYLKLQMAEVSYKLPMQNVNMINNFEIYVNGNNLWTWSSLPSEFDPEAQSLEVYPISRRYNVGFRMTF
ncbi:SusC/RagA family TonB-linked outer membrane protein [Reichenbachiella agariperforans]|uniref:SusC/RagA family TonB-linked outer membrane protein n=1 Tax=Reichenbachiella agariperforans TaxID=156994 RepID=UPI001C09BBF4|nr:TonB-dependent receptor [Reichenbachiella agariperforans]MBU2912592.1 TonB-dependent receptor [Reichenbachiella agariperforans]